MKVLLGVIVKGGFDPLPVPGDVFSGVKTLNDGFANIPLVSDADAEFANTSCPSWLIIMGSFIPNPLLNPIRLVWISAYADPTMLKY